MRNKYVHMRDTNEHLLRNLERQQQELDALNLKKENLEEVTLLKFALKWKLHSAIYIVVMSTIVFK